MDWRGVFCSLVTFVTYVRTQDGVIDLGKIHGAKETGCANRKIDIVFVLDESSSIWNPDFKRQLQFLEHVADDFQIGPDATQIGVLTYSDVPRHRFYMNDHPDRDELKQAIRGIVQSGGGTYTAEALESLAQNYFLTRNGGRPGVPDIGIIITDGESIDKKKTLSEAAKARAANITMVAIGVGANVDKSEIDGMASEHVDGGGKKYTFTVEDYEALDTIRVELAKVTCIEKATYGPWTPWGPCSTTCGGGRQFRTRQCVTGDCATIIGEPPRQGRSCSMKPCPEWTPWTFWGACSASCGSATQKRARLCRDGEPGIDCEGPKEEIKLCTLPACPNWTPWTPFGACSVTCGGGTQISARRCVNGQPGVDCPGEEARRRRCNDKACPSWTPWTSYTECSTPCGPGTQTRSRVCKEGLPGKDCPGSPEETRACNLGKCTDNEDPCCGDLNEADIAFISDSAHFGGVKGNNALKFIHNAISGLPIEEGKVRAALVSNKCIAKMGFFLNTYKDKTSIINHIDTLPGDEVVTPMLQDMRTVYFATENGARAGAKRIAVMVIDDDAKLTYKTMDEILRAKDESIEFYVVGMSPNIDQFKMNFMADAPANMHTIKIGDGGMENLEEMRRTLNNNICKRLLRRK